MEIFLHWFLEEDEAWWWLVAASALRNLLSLLNFTFKLIPFFLKNEVPVVAEK